MKLTPPPPEPEFTPDRRLRFALPRMITAMALQRAGLRPDPTLGDMGAHARVVFFHMPWLAKDLMDALPPPDRAQEVDPALLMGGNLDPGPELPPPDLLLGTSETTAQFGLFGRTVAPDGTHNTHRSEKVFLDTNGAEFLCISGANGSGKSSTLAVAIENGTLHMRNLNRLRRPFCTVAFVLHNNNRELLAGRMPNSDPRAVRELISLHQTVPRPLPNLKRLVLPSMFDDAVQEFPMIPTLPAWLPPGQLGARGFELALGLFEHRGTRYASTAMDLLSGMREGATLAGLREQAKARDLMGPVRLMLEDHIHLGARFIRDDAPDLDVIEEGAVITVEVRDPWLEESQRVVLATVLMDVLLKQAQRKGVHVLFTFDEAHNVLSSQVLVKFLSVLIEERRHLGVSLALLGLDMLKLPEELLALASVTVLHRCSSEANLKHHGRAHPKWRLVNGLKLAGLPAGQAYVLATGGHFAPGLEHFLERPRLIQVRDRVSQHGGATRTVV